MATDPASSMAQLGEESQLQPVPARVPEVEATSGRGHADGQRDDWLKRKLPQHAFFGVQPGRVGSTYLRCRTGLSHQSLPMKIRALVHEYTGLGKPVERTWSVFIERLPCSGPSTKSLADLERDFFKLLDQHDSKITVPSYAMDAHYWFSNDVTNPVRRINQVQSTIAVKSRRGWATVTIVSPYVLSLLEKIQTANIYPSFSTSEIPPVYEGSILRPVGMYTGKGYGGCRLYCCDEWPDDAPVYVAYRGHSSYDAGVFLIQYEDGSYGVEVDPANQKDRFEWHRYFARISVTPSYSD